VAAGPLDELVDAEDGFLAVEEGHLVVPRHPDGVLRAGVHAEAAEDTAATAVVQHIQREYVLSYAGRGQDDPFGILLWPVTFGGYGQSDPAGRPTPRPGRAGPSMTTPAARPNNLRGRRRGRPPRLHPAKR